MAGTLISWRTRYHFFLSIILVLLTTHTGIAQVYLDSTATIEARVNDLLGRMTIDEKIGQMIQMNYTDLPSASDVRTYYLGSLLAYADDGPAGRSPQSWADAYDTLQSYALQTRLKIPLIFAIDAVHGIGAVYGATIFPHNIGLGCTRNPLLVEQAAQITAQEMSATGIDWTLGPVAAVARNENWGRTYESFGEDPNLVKDMTAAAVRGFQGDTLAPHVNILACAKHFIGDGGTTGGVNNGNTVCDEQTLRAIHLPGYITAIKQKVGSIMVAQNQWNGMHPHGDPYLLDTLLKRELGFTGIVISDANSFMYAGNPTQPFPQPILYKASIKNSINAGVDMAMMSTYSSVSVYTHRTYTDTLRTLINEGSVSITRIDSAVKRILTQKFRLGLFEHPYADRSLLSQVGSANHRAVARECVRQSLVVLRKKDGLLPIPKNVGRIHLAGRHADNMGYQCGAWTITWQGSSGDITPGTTIKEAFQQAAPAVTITSSIDGYGAEGADIGIAVIGELPYAEYVGDGRITLDPADIETVRNLKNTGIPVVVILISGRPMILDPIIHHCDAIVAAWLPGTEGEGITDVLFGDYAPVGRLSQSWPVSAAQIPINIGDAVYNPLFSYGDGLPSLADPPAGSAPGVYSSSVATSTSIEISFSKKMAPPPAAPAGFALTVNGTTTASIVSVALKNSDSTMFIVTLADSIRKENSYTVAYTAGDIRSHDQGALASFENLAVHNLLADYKYIHTVPEKIQAEEYSTMLGTTSINCTDVGGGKTLSSIGNGDWAEYYVQVPQSGTYPLEYRISSLTDTGRIELRSRGSVVSTVTLPVTGSWDAWQNVQTEVQLSEGPQVLRVYAAKGGFRLNWIQISNVTGITDNGSGVVEQFSLSQNFPNPFNPATTISFTLPARSHVELKIYDVIGREVETLVSGELPAGMHSTQWNANKLSSGIYFYKLSAGKFNVTRKLVLLK